MRAFALQYWAVNLGASVAFVAGGAIASHSFALLFAADAITTVGFGLIVWAALPETRPTADAPRPDAKAPLRAVLSDRVFMAVCLLAAAFSIVFFQSFVGLPIDMRAHGLTADVIGLVMATNGILIVVLQPYAADAIGGYSRRSVLAVAALLLGAGFGLNAWIGSPAGYAVAIAVWTLGEILFAPASTSLVADLAPAALRGRYQGVLAVAYTAAFAAAPLAGAAVIATAGAGWLWAGCALLGVVTAIGFLGLRALA
jgi:MFS family permease